MSGGRLDEALLLARTVRHLKPSQIAHRVRLRGQRAAIRRFSGALSRRLRRPVPLNPAWPEGFLPLDARVPVGFPNAEANARGCFRFLNEERALGHPHDWHQPQAAQLWRYHLHYFEWAWAFANHPDRRWASCQFGQLLTSWRASTPLGHGDAWSPYVVSVRSWVLCGLFAPLVEGTDGEADVLADVGLHAGFLRAHLELDVGGNHLVKNLKALIGLGLFLDDDRLVQVANRRLSRELPVQVLNDGGHFERSPSYHCQVLGDLLDVRDLLAAAGRPPVEGLGDAVEKMRRWLGAVLHPDGDVPLVNDCIPVGKASLELLRPSVGQCPRLQVLEPSGYVVIRPDDRSQLVTDVGDPCPPELPAHAHADCLSFELSIDGRRMVVDTGTSTYEPGSRRLYERSTAAHNTVEVDDLDQTEVWAAFRAARRAGGRLRHAVDQDGTCEVSAWHDGYRRLPGRPLHIRTWRARAGSLEVTDEIVGEGRHRAVARVHLAPGTDVSEDGGVIRADGLQVRASGGKVTVEDDAVAHGFGDLLPARTVTIRASGPLPLRIQTTLSWGT